MLATSCGNGATGAGSEVVGRLQWQHHQGCSVATAVATSVRSTAGLRRFHEAAGGPPALIWSESCQEACREGPRERAFFVGQESAPGALRRFAVRLIFAGWVPHDRVFGGGGALSRIERGPGAAHRATAHRLSRRQP